MQLEFNFFIFLACKWDIVPLNKDIPTIWGTVYVILFFTFLLIIMIVINKVIMKHILYDPAPQNYQKSLG